MIDESNKFIISCNKSEYVLTYSEVATEAENYAILTLQNYFKKVFNVTIPMIMDVYIKDEKYISIGRTVQESKEEIIDKSLYNDSFALKTKKDNIYICGAGDRGTIYGVYEFIERFFGVKFLTSEFTFIPKKDKLELMNLNELQQPDFKYRGYSYPIPKMVYVQLYSHHNLEFSLSKRFNLAGSGIPDSLGGTVEWVKELGANHNVFKYVSPEKYFKLHPDWFSTDRNNNPVELCLSKGIDENGNIDDTVSESPIKVAVESLKEFIKGAPKGTSYYMFGQNDNLRPCKCESCVKAEEKYKRSGMMIRFCNILAREGKKFAEENYPDKKVNIVHFAYTYNEEPPTDKNNILLDKSVKPEENLITYVCPIYADYYLSYTDDMQVKGIKDLFLKWKQIQNKFFVWGYSGDFQSNFWYIPLLKSLKDNVKFLKEIGTEYYYNECTGNDLCVAEDPMNAYVFYKLLWNSNLDTEELRKEYLYYLFGEKCFGYVLDYYRTFEEHIENEVRNNGLKFIGTGVFNSEETWRNPKYYSLEFLENLIDKLEKAKKVLIEDNSMDKAQKEYSFNQLERMGLVPKYMIVKNINYYYGNNEKVKNKKKSEFINKCKSLNVKMYKLLGYFKDFKI